MQILIIDDDTALCRSLQIHLGRLGHEAAFAVTGAEGLARLREHVHDLVLIDLNLPDATGLEILGALQNIPHQPLAIMITGVQDASATIEAIQLGALDYIRKPLDLEAVVQAIDKAARRLNVAAGGGDVMPSIGHSARGPNEIVGAHPKVIEILKRVALVSQSDVPVLVLGESGTGKELVARALHKASRPEQPFVAVNCSAVVPTLLESELFGHEKGAFTGADTPKVGKLEVAARGTVFFDEIGDMALDLQAKLLRVLQEREFERVGGTRIIPFQSRVVAATHQDLQRMVASGAFREDLYFRLAVTTIHVPSLRERPDDIPLLVQHFLSQLPSELGAETGGVDKLAVERCVAHEWPGNVRELRNVLIRSILSARGGIITQEHIEEAIGNIPTRSENLGRLGRLETLKEVEKRHIKLVLDANDWNIKRSAAQLDISRVTLRKKIDDYELKPG